MTPFLIVSDYAEGGSSVFSTYLENSSGHGLPFAQVVRVLRAGKSTNRLLQGLVDLVNTEANSVVALICHADGKRPASVCNLPVIRKILKHVK